MNKIIKTKNSVYLLTDGVLTSNNPRYPGPYDVMIHEPLLVGRSIVFTFTSERSRNGKIRSHLVTSRVVSLEDVT